MPVYYNKSRSSKGIPVGSIIPWAGNITDVPRGWLPCNGNQNYRVQDYPLLYLAIGNAYGGTVDISFRLPRLNTSITTPVDMFRGHFFYLNSLGEPQFNDAHKPEKTNITEDEFWKTVGLSENGNKPSTTQTNWVSTIDVTGEQVNVTDLIANYANITFLPGEVIQNVFIAGRKLGDEHITVHSHAEIPALENVGNAVEYGSGVSLDCSGVPKKRGACNLTTDCTSVTRAIPKNLFGTRNGMERLNRDYNGSRTNGVAGGSGFVNRNRGEDRAVSIGLSYDGDGVSAGDMRSNRPGGPRWFWSSLSPRKEYSSFSDVIQHTHNNVQVNFSSKFIRIINPGIVNDVRLNTVRINNETGANFGTITANTATPTISMIYLIRAF